MTLNEIAKIVTLKEGLKKSVSIGQVKEILRILNQMTAGKVYKLLREV
jgi:hypothetical protein